MDSTYASRNRVVEQKAVCHWQEALAAGGKAEQLKSSVDAPADKYLSVDATPEK